MFRCCTRALQTPIFSCRPLRALHPSFWYAPPVLSRGVWPAAFANVARFGSRPVGVAPCAQNLDMLANQVGIYRNVDLNLLRIMKNVVGACHKERRVPWVCACRSVKALLTTPIAPPRWLCLASASCRARSRPPDMGAPAGPACHLPDHDRVHGRVGVQYDLGRYAVAATGPGRVVWGVADPPECARAPAVVGMRMQPTKTMWACCPRPSCG